MKTRFPFKKLFLPAFGITFVLCLILMSKNSVNAAGRGLNLWLQVVFPSLFPFFVVSELLYRSGIVKAGGVLLEPIMRPLFNLPGSSSFAFFMGITSGYPVGAKITAALREDGLLSQEEGSRLLAFSNNSGPLFIVGAVSVGIFNRPEVGLLLLMCHLAACVTVGILFGIFSRRLPRRYTRKQKNNHISFFSQLFSSIRNSKDNIGSLLGDAIRNSISTMLAIGGFIIFFSVIISILLETGVVDMFANSISIFLGPFGVQRETIRALISGVFEITTGTSMIPASKAASLVQQLAAASMIIGWAGLSVHFQVFSIVSSTDLSIKPYIKGKLLQSVLAGLYTYLLIKLTGLSSSMDSPVFQQFGKLTESDWMAYIWGSLAYLSATVVCLYLLKSLVMYIRVRKS